MLSGRPKTGRHEVVIVGAGIAGLTAARTLVEQGHSVVVLDKGRGPGGRASSRRRESFVFDHGAQYFSAYDVAFRSQVDAWREDGVIARWTPRLVVIDPDGMHAPRQKRDRYVGVPNMRAVARHLARTLDVRSQVEVNRLLAGAEGWRAENSDGESVAEADVSIVAIPPAQAAPLLAAAPGLAEQVRRVVMQPCWAVLLGFAQPLPVDFDAAFVNVGALSWVARNSSKPGRDGGEAWVLHAANDWSEQNLEADADEVCELLKAEFASRCLGSKSLAVVQAEAHRWRYAQPARALEVPCLFDADRGIGVAGDWCGGPRIEGAFLSGLALASRILGWADDQAGGKDRSGT